MTEADLPLEARHAPRFSGDYADLTVPGVVVELPADEAAALGIFEETALTADAAWDANADLRGSTHG